MISDNNIYEGWPLLIPEANGAHAIRQKQVLKRIRPQSGRIRSDDDRDPRSDTAMRALWVAFSPLNGERVEELGSAKHFFFVPRKRKRLRHAEIGGGHGGGETRDAARCARGASLSFL